ncbi:phosphotyrosine protein phosphatase [Kushneria pakistanensis]|uniref:protein-tyrosine-phosphatase n=1 Tax=Kushneria pakistanensis TaxID=1508770 RepID=A0ABQ3FD35_9GAMM|nr:low molecular weight protein-tyrosine-phosphatase [Kushneria pakistanensis]GHC19179.1 phosphotyrosine protein phosphatase [Kushneria pakistanensis]
MIRVLFVCLGNICRSPMAEGVFRQMLHQSGLENRIETDSCGVGDYHVGEPPDPRAIREAQHRDIDITGLRGRVIRQDDFDRFDYVLCMDRENLEALKKVAPRESRAHVGLLMDFATQGTGKEIDDPYFGNTDGFECMGDQIVAGCQGLLNQLKAREASD